MAQLYDDRRDEPRFPAFGRAQLKHADRLVEGQVTDLSLNGFRLVDLAGNALAEGEHCSAQIELPGEAAFAAEVVVVRCSDAELGLEFWNMPSSDFGVLTRLLERLRRSP